MVSKVKSCLDIMIEAGSAPRVMSRVAMKKLRSWVWMHPRGLFDGMRWDLVHFH